MSGDMTLAKACKCLKWKKNIKKIDALVILGASERIDVEDIVFFRYCPWCGKKLEESWEMVGAYG